MLHKNHNTQNVKACSHQLGKCIAGFPRIMYRIGRHVSPVLQVYGWNCVQTLLNSVTDESSIKHPFTSLT